MMISYRTILVALLLAISSAGTLPAQTYVVEVRSGAYIDLTNAVELATGAVPDQQTLDIPFHFRPFGASYSFDQSTNTSTIVRDGYIASANQESGRVWVCDAYLAKMEARDETSSTSYVLEGGGENQVLKFQWKNMKLKGNPEGDFMNVQLWLYKNGEIEVHIGPNRVTSRTAFDNYPGPSIGHLIGTFQFDEIFGTTFLVGSPTAPGVDRSIPLNYLTGYPANGTIYRFHFNAESGVDDISSEGRIAFHPNPANGHTRVTLPQDLRGRETTLTLYDMLGRVAHTEKIADGSSIATGALAPGLYHAVIGSGEERYSAGKLIVR